MKPYLSLWSYGYYRDFNKEKEEFLLNSYKMSTFFLLKHYGEAHLITDNRGAEFLKKIPFTSVDTSLESLPKECSIIWSLGKLLSYKIISEKGEPFFHIDNDVFLVNKLPENFLNQDLFVQHEEFYAFYEYGVKDFFNIIPNKYLLGEMLPDRSHNFGVFGGQDFKFINKFANAALRLPLDKANLYAIHNNNFEFHHTPSTIIEQYQFSIFCLLHHRWPKPLIDLSDRKDKNNKENQEIVTQRAESIKYFHFWTEKHSEKRVNLIKQINNFGRLIFN